RQLRQRAEQLHVAVAEFLQVIGKIVGRHAPYSTLILASRITLPHFFASVSRKPASSAGESTSDSKNWGAMKVLRTSGSANRARASALTLATISVGRPAGPYRPNHDTASNPGSPLSATVGTSGRPSRRLAAPTARMRTLPAFHCGTALPTLMNMSWIWPAITSVRAGVAPL